jgi:hypothetical protein
MCYLLIQLFIFMTNWLGELSLFLERLERILRKLVDNLATIITLLVTHSEAALL